MFWPARFQGDVPFQPAAFKDQAGGGRELTNIFAEEPRRFVRENPVVSLLAGRFLGGAQQLALDPASLIDAKQVVFQTEEEIFCLPFGEGRTNPNAGERALPKRFAQAGKSIMQPPFQVSQPFPLSRASQCPNIESLESLPSALALRGGHLLLRSRRAGVYFPLTN
jgi:hypothetical protein